MRGITFFRYAWMMNTGEQRERERKEGKDKVKSKKKSRTIAYLSSVERRREKGKKKMEKELAYQNREKQSRFAIA